MLSQLASGDFVRKFSDSSSSSSSNPLKSPSLNNRRLSAPFQRAKVTGTRRLSQMFNGLTEQINLINGQKPASPLFGGSYNLNREWEIVTVQEVCRRLSLSQLDAIELPIPDGANTSRILDEQMIRQLLDVLPPRAEGYPWSLIYNTEKHGFSLATMYRKMAEWDDQDMSPVLLIIRDINEHVFGCVVSTAIRPSEHFFGTGDSCFLWRFVGDNAHTRRLQQFPWSGDNQFFVKASRDSLSVGASGGHYGLWLDQDLNHGRSQRCATFDNEPLAGDKQDFIVQFVEAYGFRIS